jgi:hypothetical protein
MAKSRLELARAVGLATRRRGQISCYPMLRRSAVLGLGLCLFACGGAAQPAAEPGASPAPGPETSEPAAAPKAAGGSLEDQREPFVKSCIPKAHSKEYCECGFEQFKEVFKDADLSKPLEEGDPRVAKLRQQTSTACASKLTEADVKGNFTTACVEDDSRRATYCDCAWTSLRKKLAYADFIALDENDPRFVDQKKVMVVDCKGKFPTEIAKLDFMKACTQGQPTAESSCTCKWNKLKKQFTTEELVAGTVDVASVKGLADCK